MRTSVIVLLLLLLPVRAIAEERLVVVGQQLNEIVFALGAGDRVVATHGYRDHIPGIDSAAQIQGFGPMVRSAENLLAYRPTAVWAMKGRVEDTVLQQLSAVGVPVELFPDSWRLEQIPAYIEDIAERLATKDSAQQVIDSFTRQHNKISALSSLEAAPAAIFILAGGNRPMLVAGADSDFQRLMDLAGGVNSSSHRGYQLLSAEETMRLAPEVIFLLDEAMPEGQPPVVTALPGLRLTPAARTGTFITIDGHCLTDFGIYTPACVISLRQSLEKVARGR